MLCSRTLFFILICSLFCLGSPCTALGDIYRHVDANGVVHFTNTPSSKGYTLFLKEKKRPRKVKKGRKIRNRTRRFRAGPNVYDKIIRKAARVFGVEYALIKAVIHAESGFNPHAVSRKGARGLMQIMPQNNAALNITNSFDPSQNIMGGTRYLKRMLNRYNRQTTLALAAYNAGPAAVDKYKRVPPYAETQTYVKRVISLYSRYKRS